MYSAGHIVTAAESLYILVALKQSIIGDGLAACRPSRLHNCSIYLDGKAAAAKCAAARRAEGNFPHQSRRQSRNLTVCD